MKVCWITNIPSPYKVELFELLGTKVELTVLYEKEKEHNREDSWYNTNCKYHNSLYLTNDNFLSICKHQAEMNDILIDSDYSNPKAIYLNFLFKRMKKITILQADGGLVIKRNPIIEFFIKKVMSVHDYYLSSGIEVNKYFEYYNIQADTIFTYRFSSYTQSDITKHTELRNAKESFRKELGMLEKPIILSVGQQIPRKGYDILCKACSRLDKNFEVYIVGGTPQNEVLSLVNKFNLTNIHFIGFKDKETLSKYYASADYFVLPTRYDIWGLVINEAMSYGLPIISSDKCVAALEFNHIRHCCDIFPSENDLELSNKIKNLLSNPEKASILAQNSLTTIRDYTIENTSHDIEKILILINSKQS